MSGQPSRSLDRLVWPFVGFLLAFAVMLIGVCRWYLLPAMDAFNHADKLQRRLLGLHALLIMSALLVALGMMMVLMFRVGRFFFPRPGSPRSKTTYTDAWTEAGKRMRTPDESTSDE